LTDWENSKLPKEYIKERSIELCQKYLDWCEWEIIHETTEVLGCVSQRRYSLKNNPDADFFIWLDCDEAFTYPFVKNGRKILQIKDSYGNAFAPFLSAHYEEVYIVDYRYFEGNIKELVKKYGITDIIFSHNLQVVNSSYTTFRESKMLTGRNSRIISTKKDTINTKK
jgi:hypothetical protein